MKDTCTICKTKNVEVCQDLVCRKCHKSLSFEDCISKKWENNFKKKLYDQN